MEALTSRLKRGGMSYGQHICINSLKALSRGLPYNFPNTIVVDVEDGPENVSRLTQ